MQFGAFMVQLVKTASPIINQFAAGSIPDRGKTADCKRQSDDAGPGRLEMFLFSSRVCCEAPAVGLETGEHRRLIPWRVAYELVGHVCAPPAPILSRCLEKITY